MIHTRYALHNDRLPAHDMQDSSGLVDKILTDNRSQRQMMLAAITSGEAIAFVGAGLSVPLGYPSWPRLMQELTNYTNQFAPYTPSEAAKVDILEHAEEIRSHFEKHGKLDEFKNLIGREFAPKSNNSTCTLTYELLAGLPFRAFITTNYETSLEQAHVNNAIKNRKTPGVGSSVVVKKGGQDCHRVSSFLRSIAEVGGEPRIAYLHGRFDDTENIVLTTSDYVGCYGVVLNNKQPVDRSVTLHYKLMWSLFATRKMIFFGCSMEDPYIKVFLDKVAHDLWEQNQTTHFVVLPIDEKTALRADGLSQQFLQYGLQPVFFDNRDGVFSKLDQLLKEAYAFKVNTRSEEDLAVDQKSIPTDSNEKKKKTFVRIVASGISKLKKMLRRDAVGHQSVESDAPSCKAVNPDWLEEINTTTAKDLKKNED